MTSDEAIEAVRRTLPTDRLRVDRRLARHDQSAYLLVVLDVRRELDDGGLPVENGPRLVAKAGSSPRRVCEQAYCRSTGRPTRFTGLGCARGSDPSRRC